MDIQEIVDEFMGPIDTDLAPIPVEERLASLEKLTGVHAMYAIRAYQQIEGLVGSPYSDEDAERFHEKMKKVWDEQSRDYPCDDVLDFIRQTAKDVLGREVPEREALPSEDYERVYSYVHTIVSPHMIMGRMDKGPLASLLTAPENTLARILEAYQAFKDNLKRE